ncbi:MAG TPA: alginate export family protein, partial [Elusimicrobiota bacterium]|nr:alginate export family protein [Elusimicrobiota bacterium]
ARFYMTTWLNQDVEASFRLQSINLWGMEGNNTLVTRYPSADGGPWVENVYIHMPNFAWKKVNLTVGRQPIAYGDGLIVSDDELGFNAIRAQMDFFRSRLDVDMFTAKVTEGFGEDDFDLNGVMLGTNREHNRWELSWVQEQNNTAGAYVRPTTTVTANDVTREFYDLRLFGDLKDAYYKLELALQRGNADLATNESIRLKGMGQKLELGAQTDTARWGRFGVRAVYAVGSGDDAGTPSVDEAFRPTFARRWDGLQRTGYGTHFGGTLSDAYAGATPFSPTATGLPLGFSGIKTMGLGIFSTQGVLWTGSVDYYTFNSLTKPTGLNDLGTEIDASIIYRYTGFVTFKLGAAYFFPGEVYGHTASRVTRYTAETHVHF